MLSYAVFPESSVFNSLEYLFTCFLCLECPSLHTYNIPLQLFTQLLCQFSSVQSLSRVRLFATPRIAARQASLSITNSQSSLRLSSIKSVMPSSHLIFCRPLLLLPLLCSSILPQPFSLVSIVTLFATILQFFFFFPLCELFEEGNRYFCFLSLVSSPY